MGRPSGPAAHSTAGRAGSGGRGVAGPARGRVRGSVTSLPLLSPGWAETHMAQERWHHHTGTRGWARAWLLKVAGREETPGKKVGSVCMEHSTLPPAWRPSPDLTNTRGALITGQVLFSDLYIRIHSIWSLKQSWEAGTVLSPYYRRENPGGEKLTDSPKVTLLVAELGSEPPGVWIQRADLTVSPSHPLSHLPSILKAGLQPAAALTAPARGPAGPGCAAHRGPGPGCSEAASSLSWEAGPAGASVSSSSLQHSMSPRRQAGTGEEPGRRLGRGGPAVRGRAQRPGWGVYLSLSFSSMDSCSIP